VSAPSSPTEVVRRHVGVPDLGRPFEALGIGRDEVGAIVLACEAELDIGLPNALVEVVHSPEDLRAVLETVLSHRGGVGQAAGAGAGAVRRRSTAEVTRP